MDQEPRKVAAFVTECLDYRRSEAPDLHPCVTSETLQELGLVEYKVDTFSSDYYDRMTMLMSLVLSYMPMEPSLAPLRAPPVWGQLVICNQRPHLMQAAYMHTAACSCSDISIKQLNNP